MVVQANADDINTEALRSKYSQPREQLRTQVSVQASDGAVSFDPEAEKRLNEIIMCQACQAHGVVKRQYEFRVIDETCEVCGGEGVLKKGMSKDASEELKEKVKRVEDLVANAADLDELERLEAALRTHTIDALDAVLKRVGDAGTVDVPLGTTAA